MHRVFLFYANVLHVQIVVQHGLHAFTTHVGVHLVDAAAVIDFELFVATFPVIVAVVFAFMVANAGRDTCGNLRSSDFHDAITEFLAFAARNCDAHEREENAVGAKHLAEFFFMDIERADFFVVHNRTETRTAEAHFGMRILLL